MGGGWSQDDQPQAPVQREATGETKASAETKLLHNYEAIINNSDSPIDQSSTRSLYDQLYTGVFLNGKRKKYWVDKQGKNCFMVFAKDLSITWGNDRRYWHWHDTEASEGLTAIAELRNVCWLEILGRFDTTYLSPDVTYEVAFVIMMKDYAYGWEVPVNLRLRILRDGNELNRKESLKEKPRNKWLEIPAGEVKSNDVGELEFSLFEYDGGQWKRGILIKGVVIHPKTSY